MPPGHTAAWSTRHGGGGSGSRFDTFYRSRGAQCLQADGLQGRIRGRAALLRSGLQAFAGRAVREPGQDFDLPGAAAVLGKGSAHRSAEKAQVRPVDFLKAFAVLKTMKGLRGTALDIFGYTTERDGAERRLVADYSRLIERLAPRTGRLQTRCGRGPGGIAARHPRLRPYQAGQSRKGRNQARRTA